MCEKFPHNFMMHDTCMHNVNVKMNKEGMRRKSADFV